MKASANRTTGTLITGNQETSTTREKNEMKATINRQNKLAVMNQEISKFKEDIAMNLSRIITNNTPATFGERTMTDKLLQNYPKQVTLDMLGARVILRPLEPTDEHQLLRFFNRIPAEDRYYLKEDVSSPSVIAKWARNIDYDQVLPLIALVDSEIVADATLHRNQAGAEIRIVVEPSRRNQGLGTIMLEELIYIAYDRGQDRIFMQLVEEGEDNAIRVAEMMGFQRVATLPGFAKEITGEDRNLVILELTKVGQEAEVLEWARRLGRALERVKSFPSSLSAQSKLKRIA